MIAAVDRAPSPSPVDSDLLTVVDRRGTLPATEVSPRADFQALTLKRLSLAVDESGRREPNGTDFRKVARRVSQGILGKSVICLPSLTHRASKVSAIGLTQCRSR